jgi:hypothetical protein
VIGKDHKPENIRRIVILVEENDGTQHGYEVISPTVCSWQWAGLGAGGSHADVFVSGVMHRKSRDPELQAKVDEITARNIPIARRGGRERMTELPE